MWFAGFFSYSTLAKGFKGGLKSHKTIVTAHICVPAQSLETVVFGSVMLVFFFI